MSFSLKQVQIVLVIVGIFLFMSSRSFAQDTLKSTVKINTYLCGDASSIGFYGGIGAQALYNKFGFSLSYLIDYSKAELPLNGPFGVGISVAYFPNLYREKKIHHYINTDYRLIFHKRYCVYDCSKKYNKTHEITLGYGISIRIFKKLLLSNSINAGWYIESNYSDRTGKIISNTGINTLIQTRLNFHF